jgi:hypothetical protein
MLKVVPTQYLIVMVVVFLHRCIDCRHRPKLKINEGAEKAGLLKCERLLHRKLRRAGTMRACSFS